MGELIKFHGFTATAGLREKHSPLILHRPSRTPTFSDLLEAAIPVALQSAGDRFDSLVGKIRPRSFHPGKSLLIPALSLPVAGVLLMAAGIFLRGGNTTPNASDKEGSVSNCLPLVYGDESIYGEYLVARAEATFDLPRKDGKSFRQIAGEAGFNIEPLADCPSLRTDRAGREGLFIRPVPFADRERFAIRGRINCGDEFSWIKEYKLTEADKSDLFGLTPAGDFVRLGAAELDGRFDSYLFDRGLLTPCVSGAVGPTKDEAIYFNDDVLK